EFLPLSQENWIVTGNALRLDWSSICPPSGKAVDIKSTAQDLFETPLEQSMIEFSNDGGETYICGNPPYRGSKLQTVEQKSDLALAWCKHPSIAKSTDLVTGWFARFFDYIDHEPNVIAAFVATNSVCQGSQASDIWPVAFSRGCEIRFAQISFKWANLATHNAGVTVVIIGLGKKSQHPKWLYQEGLVKQCSEIGPYLVPGSLICVKKESEPLCGQAVMVFGNTPIDGGHLLLTRNERDVLDLPKETQVRLIRRIYGSAEFIRGLERYCLWIEDETLQEAQAIPAIAKRIQEVHNLRLIGGTTAKDIAYKSHQFQRMFAAKQLTIVLPAVSSENREYLPAGVLPKGTVVSNLAFAMFDAPLWNMAIIVSRLHWVWIATVCGKLGTSFRYSNTLGWNTFPVPTLTEQNRVDLTRCAEEILLARERHYPKTIADLYEPEEMPDDLKRAHDVNDETLERIYIGRRFKNDTERLEKLFEMYVKLTANDSKVRGKKK
ncbi:MAG: lactate dehydrogenase, partial [Actinobacteria bacterium]|nr:lactate dehydrogenase [Actinomycetota bacterium]